MSKRGAESEAAMHPLLALQAGVTIAPNVTLHLETPLSNGVRKEVLLSMTAVKMKPLNVTAALPPAEAQGFDKEPYHLLIIGQESFDPAFASLSHDNEVASLSMVSDLTSNSGTASNLTGRSRTASIGNVAGAGSGQWHNSNRTERDTGGGGGGVDGGESEQRRSVS